MSTAPFLSYDGQEEISVILRKEIQLFAKSFTIRKTDSFDMKAEKDYRYPAANFICNRMDMIVTYEAVDYCFCYCIQTIGYIVLKQYIILFG